MEPHRFLSLFLTEGRELLDRADGALLALERAPEHTAGARTGIDATFRALHSLKGMCATVGLEPAAAALHRGESVLALARRDGAITPHALDALLALVHGARQSLDAAEQGRPVPVELHGVVARLDTLLESHVAAAPPHSAATAAQRVREATAIGGAAWRVEVQLDAMAPVPLARATVVVRRLAALAPVLRVAPDAHGQSREDWDRRLVVWLGAGSDESAIERAVRGAGDVADVHVVHEVAREAVVEAETLRTVRIPVQRLDDLLDLVGELMLARDRLLRDVPVATESAAGQALEDASRLVTQLRDAIVTSRLVPLAQVLDRFPRFVRDASQSLGKEVELVLEGRELEVDRSLLDELADPLLHLLRNAIDHGIERPEARLAMGKPARGRLVVRAVRDGGMVAVTVADDGAGVDRARVVAAAETHGISDPATLARDDAGLLQLLARPGLSTAHRVSELSGRGVGVDAVLSRVQARGGRIELATATGAGTAITLRLPLSVAMLRALFVRVAGETYAIPLSQVHATVRIADVSAATGDDRVDVAGEAMPRVRLRAHLGLPVADDVCGQLVVIEGTAGRRALEVDACTAQQEIVVKPLQRVRGAATLFSGGTILSDGTPSLILDINALP